MERFTKTFKKHKALNVEHKNILISILVEDLLPNIKKQTENNVVGGVGQPPYHSGEPQLFEKLKRIVLVL